MTIGTLIETLCHFSPVNFLVVSFPLRDTSLPSSNRQAVLGQQILADTNEG